MLLIFPKVDGIARSLPGCVKLGWFSMLKNSVRKSRYRCSVQLNFLPMLKSQLVKPGPRRMPTPEFPNCPAGGCTNPVLSIHRSIVGLDTCPLPMRFGRGKAPARGACKELDRNREACARLNDAADIPTAHQRIRYGVPIVAPRSAFTDRQLISSR